MKPHYKALDDDEGVDRIEIHVVPRYKTSGLSGNEWRISASVRMWRKGVPVLDQSVNRMETAVLFLGQIWATKYESSPIPLWANDQGKCNQPGCSEPAVIVYELKQQWSARGEGPLPASESPLPRRAFCAAHATRGDCSFEDADANYAQIEGPKPSEGDVPLDAISPSARVVVDCGSVSEPRKEQP